MSSEKWLLRPPLPGGLVHVKTTPYELQKQLMSTGSESRLQGGCPDVFKSIAGTTTMASVSGTGGACYKVGDQRWNARPLHDSDICILLRLPNLSHPAHFRQRQCQVLSVTALGGPFSFTKRWTDRDTQPEHR